jgi:hypothetical protein
MLVDDVPEFMLEHIGTLSKRKPKEKLGIVNHLKLLSLLVNLDTSSRNGRASGLVDAPRNSPEKRLVAKKEISLHVDIVSLGFHVFYLTSAPDTSRAE